MNRALSFLGILNRGGKLVFGPAIEGALPHLDLLLVAFDAKGSTRILTKAKNLQKEVCPLFNKEQLGQALGYDELSYVGIKGKKEALAFLSKTKGAEYEEK